MDKLMSTAGQTIRAMIVVALAFVHSYWIPKLFIVPLQVPMLGDWAMAAFDGFVTVLYVAITVMAHRFSHFLARESTTIVSVCISIVGAFVLLLGTRVLGPVVLLAGIALYCIGSYWLNLFIHISLAQMDSKQYLAGVALAFPVARFAAALLANFDIQAALVLGALLPVAMYMLSCKGARTVLASYSANPSPYDLNVTNPSSFLPFTNKFFVALFLFVFVYATLPASEADAVQHPLPLLTVIVPVLVIGYQVVTRRSPKADFLFQVAALLMVAAVRVPLVSSKVQAILQSDFAACGLSFAELLLYWYAVILLGSRNTLSILPTLAWGRAALSTGATVGDIVKIATVGDPGIMAFVSAGVAFLFIGYNLVALKRFDFDVMASRTVPVRVVPERVDTAQETDRSDDDTVDRILVDWFHLTPREVEVCLLLARGRSYRYIENKLVLSRNTVKSHIKNIYSKMDVHSQQALIDVCEELLRSGQGETEAKEKFVKENSTV